MNSDKLMKVLEQRFLANPNRHPPQKWEEVAKLLNDDLIQTIQKMEDTGGEPDFVELQDGFYYVDMSAESPSKRRSLCYDKEARINRKKFPPETSAEELADSIGVEIMTEDMYFELQKIDKLDQKTSSWIKTNDDIRSLKGALFGDRRFNRTFIFHNTAESYYKDRGFRGYIELK